MKNTFQIITLIPGIPWIVGGVILMTKSFRFFLRLDRPISMFLVTMFLVFILIGFLKYYLIFKKTILKQIFITKAFLLHNSKKNFLKDSFEFKKMLLYFLMIMLSIILKKKLHSEFVFFLLRTAVGTGLFISGTVYLKKLKEIF